VFFVDNKTGLLKVSRKRMMDASDTTPDVIVFRSEAETKREAPKVPNIGPIPTDSTRELT
jgi:hypothetical protein